jgi:hypothetical protein
MRHDLSRRLARAEITAFAISWADRQAADHRESLRLNVRVSQVIREGLIALGIDPALAVCLRRGDAAAAELADIPDTEALRTADEAIVAADYVGTEEAAAQYHAKIERLAEPYRDGKHQPDFASASPAELMAFCVTRERAG